MLIAFYYTLIVFFILSLVTGGYFIITFKNKTASIGNKFALGFLLIFCLVITVIYGSDFILWKSKNTKEASGAC